MASNDVIWISLNPTNKEIDYYPLEIANLIENKYKSFNLDETTNTDSLFLGKEFYNATLHFNKNGALFQTTPEIGYARSGFYKPPGFRSVARIELQESEYEMFIYVKKYNGEWRIINNVQGDEEKINLFIPNNVIIYNQTSIKTSSHDVTYSYWNPEDLSQEDKYVVVWQWCRGTYENNGNVITLPDHYWLPFLQQENSIIENAFSNNEIIVEIQLSFDNSTRIITFKNNYGIQSNQSNDNDENFIKKERAVRRQIITIKKLNEMLYNMNNKPLSAELLDHIDDSLHPIEFICPITQTIMSEPVKTVDGFIYDKYAIERWFQTHSTSPCTGLHLTNKTLILQKELFQKIQEYIKKNLEETAVED